MTELRSPSRRQLRRALACAVWVVALAGCITPWERSALLNDKRAEIGSVQGPTERNLRKSLFERRKKAEDKDESPSSNLLQPIVGIDEYHAAEELYNNERYVEAEKAFKNVARKFRKSEIREDALLMQAEAAFAQERFAKAHDLYATILKEYPATRHLDKISSRLFKIAMLWLDHPQVAELNEVQQVNHEDYGKRKPAPDPGKAPKRNIFVPNFTDKKRPVFDTPGNALTALRSIWTNDPTGPLADDALMLAASYYARSGDFIEADRHYTMLREQFPNSAHVQKAFELGSHMKLVSYQGASYDGKMLHDAEQLKLATMRLYPEMENKERMQTDLKRIEHAKADRLWAMAVYYERKGKKNAAAIYCHMLVSEFAGTPFGDKARAKLEQMGPGYADGRSLQSSYPDPPATLMTAIFPPNDHGGIPQPPKVLPNAPVQREPYGSKLALIKPKKQSPPGKDDADVAFPVAVPPANEVITETKPPARSISPRMTPPRPLPDDVDSGAKPAGKARLIPSSAGDEDDDGGHTRLNEE